LIAKVVGYLLEWTGSYFLVFLMSGSAYLIALLSIHVLAPKLSPVEFEAA